MQARNFFKALFEYLIVIAVIFILMFRHLHPGKRMDMMPTAADLIAEAGVGGQENSYSNGKAQRRAISLRVLASKSSTCGNTCDEEIRLLGGITRLDGYVIDSSISASDVILFGEADKSLPPIRTDDFVNVLRNAVGEYDKLDGQEQVHEAPGCSIDPNPSVINRLNSIDASLVDCRSESDYRQTLDRWCTIGREPQKVRVLGLPFNCSAARLMVAADYYMKLIVNGTVQVPGLTSLTDMREAHSDDKGVSMDRFWFTGGSTEWTCDKNVAVLKQVPVLLQTEKQLLKNKYRFDGTGHAEPIANEFAQAFTMHYDEIARRRPIYARLEQLFRSMALAKIMCRCATNQAKSVLSDYQTQESPVPTTLPGIASVRRMGVIKTVDANTIRTETHFAVTCGGVALDGSLPVGIFDPAAGRVQNRVIKSRPFLAALWWLWE